MRHVDAVAREVDAEILPVVGKLQRRADRIGAARKSRVAVAEHQQHQAAYGVGGAPAIVEQLVPGRRSGSSPCPGERRRAGRRAARLAMPSLRTVSRERDEDGAVGPPRIRCVEARLPLVELFARAPSYSGSSAKSSAAAGKGVERVHVLLARPGDEQPHGKVLVMGSRDPLALGERGAQRAVFFGAGQRRASSHKAGRPTSATLPP